MHTSGEHPRKQNNSPRNVWMSACFLLILVAVTAAFLVTSLVAYIHRSDYQISLSQGLITKQQNAASTTRKDVTASGTAATLTGKQARQFDFQVSDDENVWSTNTTVELFQGSYTNDEGQITVKSADGTKVVAPGTSGSYTFSLKNASKLNSNYKVWLEADLNLSSAGIPIEFRMSGKDGWTDGTGAWLTADELNKIAAHKNLYSGKSTEYTLYWRWPFERGTDTIDTAYGNAGLKTDTSGTDTSGGDMTISQTISYKVTLHTLAAEGLIKEDGSDDDNNGDNNDNNNSNNNSNNSNNNGNNNNGNNSSNNNSSNNTNNNGNGNNGTGSNSNTDNSTNSNSASRTASNSSGTHRQSAKTGDTTQIWKWILLIAAAAITATTVLRRRKKH